MSKTTLVDTFSQIKGDPGQLPTYNRGEKRTDYILTSQALVPYISRIGELSLYGSNLSDHRGVFMDILEIIPRTKVSYTRPTKCHIGSKNKPNIIYQYKQYIHKQYINHLIYERAKEIH
jgi:hypothetical protein